MRTLIHTIDTVTATDLTPSRKTLLAIGGRVARALVIARMRSLAVEPNASARCTRDESRLSQIKSRFTGTKSGGKGRLTGSQNARVRLLDRFLTDLSGTLRRWLPGHVLRYATAGVTGAMPSGS